jgi:hypothetical protein
MSEAQPRPERGDPERAPHPGRDPEPAGEHNEIGFRNVDEEAEHDEAGSQGGPVPSPPAPPD